MSGFQRWYELNPITAQAVANLLALPDDMQNLVAIEMLDYTDRRFEYYKRRNTLRSYGTEKIQALYKSKRKQRDFDRISAVHHLINALMLFSGTDQSDTGEILMTTSQAIADYLRWCHASGERPSKKDLRYYLRVALQSDGALIKHPQQHFLTLDSQESPLAKAYTKLKTREILTSKDIAPNPFPTDTQEEDDGSLRISAPLTEAS